MTNTGGDSCGGKCDSKTNSKPPHGIPDALRVTFTRLFECLND